MFAESRTASDPGRIRFLIVSIITINGIRIGGVPVGIKCLNILFVFFVHPYIINDDHIGIAIDNENIRCDDAVKIYGISLIMLLIRIKMNVDISSNVDPLFFIIIFISFNIIIIITFIISDVLLFIIQNFVGIIIRIVVILIQFIDNVPVHGSNVENKFVIIFSLYFYFLFLFFLLLCLLL